LFIFFFSLFGNDEPFYNYKHDKVYKIINNGLIPLIDGKLNDSCWLNVESINSFTQLEPNYNNIPTENTVVKIIQDDYALYISAQLHDKSPLLIAQKYVNRDDFPSLSKSDWFSISIDSHHDHQTAYNFTVNAAGVQFDSFLFDDTDEEMNWDGVWQSMVSIDDNGWNVEMRIPFSSLRFSDIKEDSEWGIDIHRYIHRKNEDIDWVVLPKGTSAGVSKFGHLKNIKNIENERIIEVIPYISMGHMRYDDIRLNDSDKEKTDFHSYDTTFYYPKIGLDVKIHLSNNTTVDFTTFPDFGQIESDPADINFTYYDTYFQEKRNFFLENITFFDTPIDLFHSRRIGENPDYEIIPDSTDYKQSKEALVLGAAKITGKTESDISYGLITATTIGQKSSAFVFDFDGPIHNYLIGRLSKDILAGNSYIGITGTNFNNSERHSSVISYDGLYYLLSNRLFIDSQLIYSMSEDVNGLGTFLEFEYSIPNLVQFGSSLEYYDKDLRINDIGYLIRNNLFKLNTKLVYHNDKLLLNLRIRDFSVGANHIFSKNNNNYLLSNVFNSMFSFTFTNYSFLDISHRLSLESYEDRLYVFTEDTLYIDKIGKIPSSNTFQIDFGNDPTDRFYFDFSFTNTKTNLSEEGNKYFLLLGANVTKDSDVSMSFLKIAGDEEFRFLDNLSDEIGNHFIFANAKNLNQKFTFRYNKFFQNGMNIQLYHEYFSETHLYHKYSEFSELTMNSDYPSFNTEYILLDDFYCDFGDDLLIQADDQCSLNPNDYIYHFPHYNELNFNLILSWEYSKKSNIYFIYKIRKAIVGHDIADYMDFINHKHSNDLSEIWRDQAVYIKMDYWFDF